MTTPSPSIASIASPRTITSSGQASLKAAGEGFQRLLLNPLAVVGLLIIIALIVIAAIAPLIARYDPVAQNLPDALQAPGWDHWFGTDEYGRDIYSRVIYGSRITLYIVAFVTVTVSPLGLLVGTVAGYFGGWIDAVLMRVTDIFLSFPSLILSLAFVAVLGPSLQNAVLAIALTSWPAIARLARAETMTIRNSDYVAAARLQGASPVRIIFKQVIPMCLSSVVIRSTLNMAGIILTAAGLGFLGLGAQPPLPEWGAMTSTGRKYMLDSWWLVTTPGIAIVIVSLAFNLFGDGLRDVLDTRSE